ncbi:hypothetical protein [Mesorhizobium sp. M0244]|uniref:hypothetical protein n=1 Tax=Mesorhizobium sp. M0244 TaxID=2956926 RepID=UPI003337DE31
MKISEHFASNYLKADDLAGKRHHVVIASVGTEPIGGEDHILLYFRGKQKALVCNKTNGAYLAAAISDETDEWPGHEIVLYPTKVNFQGRMVDAIRVEMPPKEPPKAEPASPPRPPAADGGSSALPDDAIPF